MHHVVPAGACMMPHMMQDGTWLDGLDHTGKTSHAIKDVYCMIVYNNLSYADVRSLWEYRMFMIG